jgi:hypothetical protein
MFRFLDIAASSILLLMYSRLELAYWQALAGLLKELNSKRTIKPIAKTISRSRFFLFITLLDLGLCVTDFSKVTCTAPKRGIRSIK